MRTKRYKFRKSDPQVPAICDRCGMRVEHRDLREQTEYRGGDSPVGIGVRICGGCFDEPQPFFARPITGTDPTPVRNPRPPVPME